MDVHPIKNGINRYWPIPIFQLYLVTICILPVQSLHQVTGQCFHRSSDPVSFYLRSGGLGWSNMSCRCAWKMWRKRWESIRQKHSAGWWLTYPSEKYESQLVWWLFPTEWTIPSCKRLHNYGKSPCLMGKSTISMAMFNSFLYVYQRVSERTILVWHFEGIFLILLGGEKNRSTCGKYTQPRINCQVDSTIHH